MQWSQRNTGFSASVSIGPGAASGSLNAGRTHIHSNYQSATEQSGIRAGDGGFQVNVAGNTTLVGGVMTSSEHAVQQELNQFSTAGQTAELALHSGALTLIDLENHADYQGRTTQIGVHLGTAPSTEPPSLSGMGTGSLQGDASSITQAAISGIAGATNARTGDTNTGIAPIFDAQRISQDIQAQAAITQEFGTRASQAWGDYAGKQEATLWLKAQQTSDPDIKAQLEAEAAGWSEGGVYRTSGHALLGLASGGVEGAAGAFTSAVLMPEVARLSSDMQLPEQVKQGLELVAATALGSLAGGRQGAASAFNLDANNRQLHSFEQDLAQQLSVNSEYTPDQIADALRAMYNDELGEAPSANIIVNIHNPDAGDLSLAHGDMIVDEGGTWIYAGNGNLIQSVPRDIEPELVAYIVSQTGGEDSPYRMPIYELPAEAAEPGQPVDRLTGRPLDDEGRYTVSHVVNGQVYHVKYWPCADRETLCAGKNVDTSTPSYEAWNRALNAQALRDMSTVGSVAMLGLPSGAYAIGAKGIESLVGTSLVNVTTWTPLIADYLDDNVGEGLTSSALQAGFINYGVARGLPRDEIIRFSTTLGILGVWDNASSNAIEIINFED